MQHIVFVFYVCWCCFLLGAASFTKVVVPAVYKEWLDGMPDWARDKSIQEEYGYTVKLYQRLDPEKPNFVKNRGSEGGVYLRYIVDHYDTFPDVAIFVHARPEDHQKNWLEMIKCISPNATYLNINVGQNICRNTANWPKIEIWVEQCFRDVLQIAWEMTKPENMTEFHERVPVNKRLTFCFVCCQQFILSRDMMRQRPLHVWKELYEKIAEHDSCHMDEPDYENLYSYHQSRRKVGPEPPDLVEYDEGPHLKGWGRHTQGSAMEHLSHVIFGYQWYDMEFPTMKDYCQNFLSNCPHSPCK